MPPLGGILKYLEEVELESWDFYALYHTYPEQIQILQKGMERLKYEARSYNMERTFMTILEEASKDKHYLTIEWILEKYTSLIQGSLIIIYQRAVINKDYRLQVLFIENGFVPPSRTFQKGEQSIISLIGSREEDRESLSRYRALEERASDYFVRFYPLQNGCKPHCIHIYSFLICMDGERLCGSLSYYKEEEDYVISEFSTRTIMDPIYKGTGRMIFRSLVGLAKRNSIKRILLTSSNIAMEFYIKMGFKYGKDVKRWMVYIVS